MKYLCYMFIALCSISCGKHDDGPVPPGPPGPPTNDDTGKVDTVKSIYPYRTFYLGQQRVYSELGSFSTIFDTAYTNRVEIEYPDSTYIVFKLTYIDQTGNRPNDRVTRHGGGKFVRNDSGTYKDDPKYTYLTFTVRGDSLVMKYYFPYSGGGGESWYFDGIKEK
jgi:hypothetical protein